MGIPQYEYEDVYRSCIRIMIENPDLFPIVEDLISYCNTNNDIQEKDKWIRTILDYSGVRFVSSKLLEETTTMWNMGVNKSFEIRIKKSVIKATLIVYSWKVFAKEQHDKWIALLIKEGLPL